MCVDLDTNTSEVVVRTRVFLAKPWCSCSLSAWLTSVTAALMILLVALEMPNAASS